MNHRCSMCNKEDEIVIKCNNNFTVPMCKKCIMKISNLIDICTMEFMVRFLSNYKNHNLIKECDITNECINNISDYVWKQLFYEYIKIYRKH